MDGDQVRFQRARPVIAGKGLAFLSLVEIRPLPLAATRDRIEAMLRRRRRRRAWRSSRRASTRGPSSRSSWTGSSRGRRASWPAATRRCSCSPSRPRWRWPCWPGGGGRGSAHARASVYFAALATYGALRGLAIRAVTSQALDTPFPYLMNRPVAALHGVSLQELLGWGVAVTLALSLAEPLVRRTGRAATPHRVAAVAALGLACVCLAVENAAIAAGWWTWTLALPASGPLRVPPVALLDWGFVAFDFLLPWLLAARPAGWGSRLAALSLFPLHMLGHTWVRALPGPLPVPGYDLVHVGIVTYVLWRAGSARAVARTGPARAAPGHRAPSQRRRAGGGRHRCGLPGQRPAAGRARLAAARGPGRGRLPPQPDRRGRRSRSAASRRDLPATRSRRGRGRLAGGRERSPGPAPTATRGRTRAGRGPLERRRSPRRRVDRARRPGGITGHAGGRTLLALVLLRQGRTGEARAELDRALAAEPTARDALLMAASLDLAAGNAPVPTSARLLAGACTPGAPSSPTCRCSRAARPGRGVPQPPRRRAGA